ncbi:tail completion protein gp17 [Novosphingobium pentaromativorans]|uniref:DUF3168 domain-containing protein n=1 Tax=Novosphingobium pentaromativorans US6-1 TaxID=1088721 RepID=G6E7K3_9SPHN|nr:DUF3168 domain-containing protein [Novosphingobium pentaromativorans]AIT81597.1 hypothetical protein JI59_18395 [Novosphingobium pentaromativorans US6-1]EHJ62826.1 hypothetical protein NSU_0338 [Novosphingobium pentaromativorans US6-1]
MITRLNPANEVQEAILKALADDVALAALTSRIYPQQAPTEPVRPFVRFGAPIITPRKVDGGDSADVSAAVHCFTDSTTATPDGRQMATTIAAHIARILDAMTSISLEDGVELNVYVQQVQCMQDGDASSWHSFVTFRAEAA